MFDFIVFPAFYTWQSGQVTLDKIITAIIPLNAASQVEALRILHEQHVWVPLTLQGSGLFHVAFGALLSVSAYSHGRELISQYNANLQAQQANLMNGTPTLPGTSGQPPGSIPPVVPDPSVTVTTDQTQIPPVQVTPPGT